MSRADLLKDAILQAAMQGKLTEQLDTDSSVDELLVNIKSAMNKIFPNRKLKFPLGEIEYDIPKTWRCATLETILSISSGDGLTSKQMTGGEIPVFGSNGITGYHNKHNVEKQTIVIGRVGACGAVHITTEKAWVTDNAFIVTYPEEYINRNFLVYALRYLNLGESSQATAQPVISGKSVYPIVIPLPPIEEQQRIVERVDELLAKVDEFEKIEIQLANLKQNFPSDLRSAILQAAIQGKLTEQLDTDSSVDELIKEIDSCRKSMIKRGIYKPNNHLKEMTDSDIPFDIPDTWRWVRLGYCSTYGQTKEKATAEDCMSDIWSLDLEDIEKVTGNVVKKWRAEERQISGDKIKFYKGNILYSKLRPYLLKILIADDDGICSPELIPFDMIGGINNRYIMWVLRSPHIDFTINSVTYGVKMPRVSTDTMVNLLIPLPPIEEQQRIVDKLDKLIPLCDELNI